MNLSFVFKSKSKIKTVNDELVASIELSGYAMSPKSYRYTVLFHINPETNNFYINFLDKNGKKYDRLFLSIKDKYFSFVKSQINGIKFYKECLVCRKYNYSSSIININHKTCQLENLEVMTEYFCLGKTAKDNNIQVYKLLNNYIDDRATIMMGKANPIEFERMGEFNVAERLLPGFIETNAINLSNVTSPEQLIDKLNLFITLS